jgi:ribosomal protein S18 acetylase RimI-like enzyme
VQPRISSLSQCAKRERCGGVASETCAIPAGSGCGGGRLAGGDGYAGDVPEIVRSGASQIDELQPLWLALREHHASVTPAWGALRPPAESWARRRETYVDILAEGGVCFLAVEDGTVAGFALCEREEGGSPTWQWPPDFLSIVDLVVLAKYRRRGLGTALLHAVEEEARAREVAAVAVNAAAPNAAARRFYERHGYRLDLVTYRKPLH